MDSEPQRIIYSLPPSPPQKISYGVDTTTYMPTPSRKRRQNNPGPHNPRISKVRAHDNTQPTILHTASDISALTTETNVLELHRPLEPSEDASSLSIDKNQQYLYFLEAVSSDQCGFLQLTEDIFVANDWNMSKGEATNRWIHVQSIRNGDIFKAGCQCSRYRKSADCFHVQYLVNHQSTRFPQIEYAPNGHKRTFLCSRNETAQDGIYDTVFSVPPPPSGQSTTIKQRAIVEHHGDDKGQGTWKCSKDATAISCIHIVQARHSLRQHIEQDPSAQDDDAGSGELDYTTEPMPMRGPIATNESISTLPVPPPIWARIKSDPPFPAYPAFNTSDDRADIPVIQLDEASSCCCSTPRVMYNPFRPTMIKDCIVYGITGAVHTQIEVQDCTVCKHRFIGPDCRSIGVFNWNNRTLLTHELLDDYTNHYTSSETPFIAWVTVTSRRYEARLAQLPFLNDRLFRATWFSYIGLVRLDNDMCCTTCGPNPQAIIVDGVTLAFHRKHILATLNPPTSIHSDSITKDKVRSLPNLQYLPKSKLCSTIRSALTGPPLLISSLTQRETSDSEASGPDSGDDSPLPQPSSYESRSSRELRARITCLPHIIHDLEAINSSLALLFDRCFGPATVMMNVQTPSVYKYLFLQISAEENSLQFVNGEGLTNLRTFCALSESTNMSRAALEHASSCLASVPALYRVVQHELKTHEAVQADTLGVCRWLYIRGATVLKMLIQYPAPSVEIDVSSTPPERWQETGACYGMPKIRHRPIFPNLKYENSKDKAGKEGRGEGCNKFFSKYGQARLTGGIMGIWCTHSVCYGFHCIPAAEGRNDVFSAIYTRWKTAPKVIVYDFACALQPYCMVREPDFFSQTLFAIDVFHASGHTKCGHAAFLNTYCSTNPELLLINSSAAECGNGGLLRIRKSVAYMSQERAIIYTRTFLSIWNRHRIRAVEKAL